MQNRFLPQMLDETLRIDSMGYSPETNTVSYYYTMLGDSVSIDTGNYVRVKKSMAEEIKKSVAMAKFRARKVTFKYIYFTEDESKPITELIIVNIDENEYRGTVFCSSQGKWGIGFEKIDTAQSEGGN